MTKNISLAARTKNLRTGSIHNWNGRSVRISSCAGVTSKRGRLEAEYIVTGVSDGFTGIAFDCELVA